MKKIILAAVLALVMMPVHASPAFAGRNIVHITPTPLPITVPTIRP